MKKDMDSRTLGKLTALAEKARDNAYAPYSNHPVGVALLTSGGKVFSGCNCETANYDGTCAEAGAIAAMVVAGERKISALVVVGPGEDYLCTPCGRCRQRIREFADAGTRIYSMWKDGRLGMVSSMDDLLPHSFGPENVAEAAGKKNKNKNKKRAGKNVGDRNRA